MPAAGFEPAMPAIKQLQTYALEPTATAIGQVQHQYSNTLVRRGSPLVYVV
jgi:hypothetical protein